MPNNIYLKLNWVCTLYLSMSFVACKEVVYNNFQSGFSLLNCSVHFTSDFFSGLILFFVVSYIHIY